MVELYVNSNGVNVMVDKLESGELKFYYEPIDASDGRCRLDGEDCNVTFNSGDGRCRFDGKEARA